MMLNQPLLNELQHEAAGTRRMLERTPTESFGWKPHEKSMTLGRLASHIADLPTLLYFIVQRDEFNVTGPDFKRTPANTTEELLSKFEQSLATGVEALQPASDEHLRALWKLKNGEHLIFEMPRIAAVRNMVFNHLVHHRGQLSVYLRLLSIPLPGLYGPTADEGIPAPK